MQAAAAKVTIDRITKLCIFAIGAIGVAAVVDTTSRGFMLLSFLLYVRCNMAPSEVCIASAASGRRHLLDMNATCINATCVLWTHLC